MTAFMHKCCFRQRIMSPTNTIILLHNLIFSSKWCTVCTGITQHTFYPVTLKRTQLSAPRIKTKTRKHTHNTQKVSYISAAFGSGVAYNNTANQIQMEHNQTEGEKYLLQMIFSMKQSFEQIMERRQSLLSLTRQPPDIVPSGEQILKHRRT